MNANVVIFVEDGRGRTLMGRTTTDEGVLTMERLRDDGTGTGEVVLAGSVGTVMGRVQAISQIRDLLRNKMLNVPSGGGSGPLTPTEEAILGLVMGAM